MNLKPNSLLAIFTESGHIEWPERNGGVEQCPQRRDSTLDQLKDLIIIANKFGLYDAEKFIKRCVESQL